MVRPEAPLSRDPVRPSSKRKLRQQQTRIALVDATRSLIRSGGSVTMPAIARRADVSDATAYRHFPDLLAVLKEGFIGVWPDVTQAMPDLVRCPDPVDRIGLVTAFLARNVLEIQGAVRAMIALTIARPDATAGARPAHRIELIEIALQPLAGLSPQRLGQLRYELSIAVSAEALFTLLDLHGLDPDAAVAVLVATAQTLVRAALAEARGP